MKTHRNRYFYQNQARKKGDFPRQKLSVENEHFPYTTLSALQENGQFYPTVGPRWRGESEAALERRVHHVDFRQPFTDSAFILCYWQIPIGYFQPLRMQPMA